MHTLSSLDLKSLNLRNCRRTSENGLLHILSCQKNIKKLNLSNANGVSDHVIDIIDQNCKNLEELSLNSAELTDIAFITISGFSRLKHLNFNSSTLCDFSVFNSSHKLQNLHSLSLTGCKHLLDSNVKALSKSLPKLVKLSLEICTLLTDNSFKWICKKLKHLRYLNMKHARLSANIMKYLPLASKNLKYLKISSLQTPVTEIANFDNFEKFKILIETNCHKSITKFNK